MGERAINIVENQSGESFSGSGGDVYNFARALAGDLTGVNPLVEGASGFDLASQQGLGVGDRLWRGVTGALQVIGTVSGGLGLAAKAGGADEGAAARAAGDALEAAPNRLASTADGTPMDPARFQRIKNAFESQNGGTKIIDQSSEAQYQLFEAGGSGQTGMTISADEVLMVPDPTASTVFDEMIHTSQLRRGLVQQAYDTYGVNRGTTFLEIQVQEKLLRNAKPYGLTSQ